MWWVVESWVQFLVLVSCLQKDWKVECVRIFGEGGDEGKGGGQGGVLVYAYLSVFFSTGDARSLLS